MKGLAFRTYHCLVNVISKTGLARAFLPLSIRLNLGRALRKIAMKLSPIDLSRAYVVHGSRMYLHPSFGDNHSIIYGTYEKDTVKIFKQVVTTGQVVVDVGAHVGFYSLLAAQLVGREGKVFAFEPQPDVFAILCRNIQENGYESIVTPIMKAVGKQKIKTTLFVSDTDSGAASIYRVEGRPVEAEMISLDEFFAQIGWPRVDVVKIDAGGDEVDILMGMAGVIRRNPRIKLFIEFDIDNQIRVNSGPEKFSQALLELGFRRFYAIRHGLKPISLPRDVGILLQLTQTSRYLNLLCEM